MIAPRVYIAAALAALLLAGVWYYGHTRYNAGEAKGNARADAALVAQHAAEQDTATLAMTLQQVNNATLKAQADAAAASKRAAEAVKAAASIKQQADRDAAAYVKHLDAAKQQPGCEVLKETLCPSALGY